MDDAASHAQARLHLPDRLPQSAPVKTDELIRTQTELDKAQKAIEQGQWGNFRNFSLVAGAPLHRKTGRISHQRRRPTPQTLKCNPSDSFLDTY